MGGRGGGGWGWIFSRRPSVEKDAKGRKLSFPHLSIKTHQKQCCHFASIRRKHRAKSGAGLKEPINRRGPAFTVARSSSNTPQQKQQPPSKTTTQVEHRVEFSSFEDKTSSAKPRRSETLKGLVRTAHQSTESREIKDYQAGVGYRVVVFLRLGHMLSTSREAVNSISWTSRLCAGFRRFSRSVQ